MDFLTKNIGHIILVLVLVVFSAFFSSSETAFFSLTKRQMNKLRHSPHSLEKLAAAMLINPTKLLSTLLFGNMIVNVLFFAVSSMLVIKAKEQLNGTAAVIIAFASFCVLFLFGEILPKSLALLNSYSLSVLFALPISIFRKVLTPIIAVLKFLIVHPILMLTIGPSEKTNITTDEFKTLIQHIGKSGLISTAEHRLFNEIIELGSLKVRDCLKPRVDMVAGSVSDKSSKLINRMIDNDITKMPIYRDKIDDIIGLLYLKDMLLKPSAKVESLIRDVEFVPEQKTIESLLEFFKKTQTDTAVVVDEYGGIAGSITVENVASQLIGPIQKSDADNPVEQIGPFEYRIQGKTPLHEWANAFNLDIEKLSVITFAGLLTMMLDKIPQPGDRANIGNIVFTVEKTKKHRIESLILKFENISD